jgi:class 3 adenylate cyclase/tetratricopeptide (TPR) repeat protein
MTLLQDVVETRDPERTAEDVSQRGNETSDRYPTPTDLYREDAERRQLTVLFCDLVGSSGLSERMDPEDLREHINRFQSVCAEEVQSLEGHVAQYLGDGLLVYFGYPSAGENDAQRAVQCSFRIIQALARLNAERPGSPVSVRIGIDTGVVVIGQIPGNGGRERLALGEPPNVAARLQNIAAPDTVLIGESTYRLVQGWFDCEPVALAALKGFSRPIRAFRVIGPKPVRNRIEAAQQEGLSPFVGRRQELRLLIDAWSQAREGRGNSILIDGEAGIGKSRLAQEVRGVVARTGARILSLSCSADHQRSPLHPVLEAISRGIGLLPADSPEQKLAKLEQAAYAHPRAAPDASAVLAHLLAIPARAGSTTTAGSRVRRPRANEILIDWLLEEDRGRPLLVVWEDLQWIDPSSHDLLRLFMVRTRMRNALLLLTARPGFEIGWSDAAPVHITINRLDREAADQLIRHVADENPLADVVRSQLLEKADGVPLFLEELTKAMVVEAQQSSPATRPAPLLPLTLQSLLMSRLDGLPYGKEVARLAATIGREFSADLLRAVWPLGPDFLESGLGELVAARLILETEPGVWSFKHALIRDVSYESILHRTRRQFHDRIAVALEESWPDRVAAEPEIVATHYAQADLKEEAARYWFQAGALAIERSANVEAVDHLTRGLELLDRLPETPELVERKLEFLAALGGPLLALRGYADGQVGSLFARAETLCGGLATHEGRLFDALQGLHSHHLVRGELEAALDLSRRLAALAQHLGGPARISDAQLRQAITLYPLAKLDEARDILETRMTPLDEKTTRAQAHLAGQDPNVSRLCHLAVVLWMMGRPEEAIRRVAEAEEAAKELKHSFTLSWAIFYDAMVHVASGDAAGSLIRAEALITLCAEQGFSYRLAQGRILAGWGRARSGDRSGPEQMATAIGAARATGALIFLPYYLALLADARLAVGDIRGGLAAIDEAETIVSTTKEVFYAPELPRLRAELLLVERPEAVDEAERLFRAALAEATEQGAWSLALRSAASLARLLDRRGRGAEGRELLRAARQQVVGEPTPEMAKADELLRSLG